jgi:Uma2 family endonuclease
MPEVQTHISPEEYLAFERKAESRNEFVNGEILPLTGANRIHSLTVVNILGELGRQLEETVSEVYAVKMRVRTPAAGAYLYPDVVVVCEEPRFEDDYFDTLLNPSLVVEVLSKSTESYNRLAKSVYYRTIESLIEYLLVSQEEYRVEQYIKQGDDRWLLSDVRSLASVVELKSIGCSLPLVDVYRRVALG